MTTTIESLTANVSPQTVVIEKPGAGRRFVSGLVWALVLLVTLFTMLEWFLSSPDSAPQQGALGAISAARVVMAYVFARAVDALMGLRG